MKALIIFFERKLKNPRPDSKIDYEIEFSYKGVMCNMTCAEADKDIELAATLREIDEKINAGRL